MVSNPGRGLLFFHVSYLSLSVSEQIGDWQRAAFFVGVFGNVRLSVLIILVQVFGSGRQKKYDFFKTSFVSGAVLCAHPYCKVQQCLSARLTL
jgi:hypothetical protein